MDGEFRQQSKQNGKDTRPVIYNVGNFSKPTADKPSLLSLEEVETLFHEFGHALHGLLSNCTYKTLAGTNVARDFVELPSQIMENWATEPQVLKQYARHYETGATHAGRPDREDPQVPALQPGIRHDRVPGRLVPGHGLAYRVAPDAKIDVLEFENESLERIGLIPEIVSRYRSSYFHHIFAGEYAAGYYAYVWAEVLDADAFQAFKETGDIFNPQVAKAFRDNILSRGGTEDPMDSVPSIPRQGARNRRAAGTARPEVAPGLPRWHAVWPDQIPPTYFVHQGASDEPLARPCWLCRTRLDCLSAAFGPAVER